MMNHPAVSEAFSTTTMRSHLPILEEKLGADKELTMEIGWKDIKLLLGNYDADVILEYTLLLRILTSEDQNEVLYDELRCITTLNLWTEHDALFAHFINMKLDNEHLKLGGEKTEPVR